MHRTLILIPAYLHSQIHRLEHDENRNNVENQVQNQTMECLEKNRIFRTRDITKDIGNTLYRKQIYNRDFLNMIKDIRLKIWDDKEIELYSIVSAYQNLGLFFKPDTT